MLFEESPDEIFVLDPYDALIEVRERLNLTWDVETADDVIVRAYVVTVGTLAHMDDAYMFEFETFLPLFESEPSARLVYEDELEALRAVATLLDSAWNTETTNNRVLQAFLVAVGTSVDNGGIHPAERLGRMYAEIAPKFQETEPTGFGARIYGQSFEEAEALREDLSGPVAALEVPSPIRSSWRARSLSAKPADDAEGSDHDSRPGPRR